MSVRRKGISPLVAVIMLIAFTMVIAGILASWATRFATDQTSMLDKCMKAGIRIERAAYDNSTGNLMLMLYNSGSVAMTGFDVVSSFKDYASAPQTWNINETINSHEFSTFNQAMTRYDIEKVSIVSKECGDLVSTYMNYYDIRGL